MKRLNRITNVEIGRAAGIEKTIADREEIEMVCERVQEANRFMCILNIRLPSSKN